jgi:hypothetical protein
MARTRTFTRDQLDALDLPGAWADDAPEILHREQVDSRRWVSVHELIFRAPDDGKAYRVHYEQGLTESQDGTDPWNGDRAVEAVEVEQYDQTVKAWRPIEEQSAAIESEQPKPQPDRPAGLAALLDHVAAHLDDEHQEQADAADVRNALAFNVAEPSPALATLRDVLLDTAPHTPHTAYAAARILLAAHARELADRAEQHITDHRIAEPTGRSVRALRTGMGSIRRLIAQQAERLDDQAQR